MLDKPLILLDTTGTSGEVTAEYFNALSHACKNTFLGISQARVTMIS